MKLSVNDADGTAVVAVLKLNGQPAVEKIDYINWEGQYHKNGKWSYTEGGVSLCDGIVLIKHMSTHSSANNLRYAHIVADNVEEDSIFVMGVVSEQDEYPKMPAGFTLGYHVWDAIVEGFLNIPNPTDRFKQSVADARARWELAEQFNPTRPITVEGPVFWSIGVDGPCTPSDPLPVMPEIPRGSLLVIGGRAPIWRYGLALHQAHGSAAGAAATFDPKIGAVVVATHNANWKERQIVAVDWPF